MINVKGKRCAHGGCSTLTNFGLPGTRKPDFCVEYAVEGTINANNRRCTHGGCGGCSRQLSYGVAGSRNAEFCVEDALEGMVNVVTKKCTYGGCPRQRSCMASRRKPEFCAEHTTEGMVVVAKWACAQEGCPKWPSYGVPGSTKRDFALNMLRPRWSLSTRGSPTEAVPRCRATACQATRSRGFAPSTQQKK